MNTNRTYTQETAGVIRYSCGVLFMLFTFCYLFFIEGEILAQAQFVFSQGVTHYSITIGAIIIAVVLQIIQWIVAKASRLPSKVHALSYVPSALSLALLTDISEVTMSHFSFGLWKWIAPAILVGYALLALVSRKIVNDMDSFDSDIKRLLYPNYIILFLLIVAVGSVPRTSDVYHYELKVERLILEGKYEEASEVATRSLRTSERLSRLRMYALSKQGRLAEDLFRYPQHYGSKGLLDVADTASTRRLSSKDICLHLGAFCGQSIKSSDRYLHLMLADTIWNQHTADYYLCGLLLNKKLTAFRKSLPLYYNLSDTVPSAYDALPRAYKEALIVISDKQRFLTDGALFIHGDSLATFSDTLFLTRYRDYNSLKVGISNLRERVNKTHRKFGDTFWWYCDFSDKAEGELSKI